MEEETSALLAFVFSTNMAVVSLSSRWSEKGLYHIWLKTLKCQKIVSTSPLYSDEAEVDLDVWL